MACSQIMASDETILVAHQIGRRDGSSGRWLFRRVDCRLHSGDRLAVTGPSGAGKTLLMRALAMLDPCDEGQILWRGRVVAPHDVPQFRSRVVYLAQRPALLEGTVEDNLRAPLRLRIHRDRRFDRDRITRWLERVRRSAEFLAQSADRLSGGEAQLVALLRALQLDPDVLLLDEPSAALDSETEASVEQLVDLWISVPERERAVIWVTHQADQARRVATRWLALRAGQLEEVASPF